LIRKTKKTEKEEERNEDRENVSDRWTKVRIASGRDWM
jgi:hypothetical protein